MTSKAFSLRTTDEPDPPDDPILEQYISYLREQAEEWADEHGIEKYDISPVAIDLEPVPLQYPFDIWTITIELHYDE